MIDVIIALAGIGIALLTPVYALLYKMTIQLTKLEVHYKACKYCQRATE